MGSASSTPRRDALDDDDDGDDDGRLRISRSVLFAVFSLSFFIGTATITSRVMAVFLVRTWFHESSEAVIGPLTGVLLSTFSAARVATGGRVWNKACDITRSPKWLLVLSAVAGGIASAWFMLETSFWRGLLARALAGALILPCTLVRCVVRSSSPSARDEAAGMAARTLGLGAAVVLVPPILGALSTPCERKYSVMKTHWCRHPDGWLVHRPFALTALFTLCVGLASVVAAIAFLPNPRVSSECGRGERLGPPVDLMFRPHLRRAAGPDKLAAAAAAAVADAERGGVLSPAGSGLPPPSPRGGTPRAPLSSVFEAAAANGGNPQLKQPPPSHAPRSLSSRTASLRRSTTALQRAESAMRRRGAALETRFTDAVIYVGTRGFAAADAAVANLDAAAGAAVAQARADGEGSERDAAGRAGATADPTTSPPWWKSRTAVAAVALYGCHTALHDGAFDLVSLTATARAPRDAVPGIGFVGLAWIISVGACGLLVASLVGYPLIARRAGPSAAVHVGLAIGTLGSAILAGAASMMYGPLIAVRLLQALAQIMYGVSSGLASSGAQVVVNLAAPSRAIGDVNRAGNAVSNAARIVAPLLAGGLWAIVAAPETWAGWLPATILCCMFAAALGVSLASDAHDKKARVVY